MAKQTSVSGVSEFVTPSPSQTPSSVATPITLGVSLSTCKTIRTSYWQTPSVTYWSASTPTITPRPSSVRLEHNVTSKSFKTFLSLSISAIDSFQPHNNLFCNKERPLIYSKLHSGISSGQCGFDDAIIVFSFLDGYRIESLINIIILIETVLRIWNGMKMNNDSTLLIFLEIRIS